VAVAAVTPRVRNIVICDDVTASLTEEGVFTLESVRQRLTASSFPCRADLNLFLVVSSPRKGRYAGKVLVINERDGTCVRYVKFDATFYEDNEVLSLHVETGACMFPEAGHYNFDVYFSARGSGDALKGEHLFTVLPYEE
jgi:hypothetical protein